jgi:hypothetical protein
VATEVEITFSEKVGELIRERGFPSRDRYTWDRWVRTEQTRRRGRGIRVTVRLTVVQAKSLRRWFLEQGDEIGGDNNLAYGAAETITMALSDVL